MVTLFCVIVGEKGSAFGVDIDANESVHDLKNTIKRENEKTITCDVDNLQLFLGKKSDGTWLDSSSDDVKNLKKGEKTPLIEALTHKDNELQGEFGLDEVLEGMQVPTTEQIHVLVVVPNQNQAILNATSLNKFPFSNGVNPLGIYFDRQPILDRMYNWITGVEGRNRFLLLNSPAASGKTLLLASFQHKYQNENLVIHYVSMNIRSDPWQYLIDFGLNINKTTCIYQNVIYLLDDAQCIDSNTPFWSALIKVLPLFLGPGVRFIISATYVMSSESTSPADFRLIETLCRDDLLLDINQSMALLNANAPLGFQLYLQNYYELKKTIVEHCNGLIGALCKSVSFYDDQLHHHVPTQVECLHLFYSKTFLDHMDQCFGIVEDYHLYPETNDILLKCALEENINWYPNFRLLEVVMLLAKAGILLFNGYHFKFSSLLAKRYFTYRYFPTRASSNPLSLHQLVKQAIESISINALKLSASSSDDFPKESTFQHLFMLGLLRNTTQETTICSELSISCHTGTQVRGEIDFCVNEGHLWGIELVRCGDKIGEHISRFGPTGKYSGLEVNVYIVLDFCRGTTNVLLHSHQATVSFEMDSNGETCFKESKLKYGNHDPVKLTLQP
jgi:Crinkler effector protein N-terminal domain